MFNREFQTSVAEQVPGPESNARFPGQGQGFAPANVPRAAPISAEEIAIRRERCAKAALQRQQH